MQNLSGPTDPAYANEFFVFFVNGTGTAGFDLPEGSVFALDARAAFVDADDAALGFYIGPNVRVVKYQADVPIGAPIPGGEGLRGRIDEVSGRLPVPAAPLSRRF